MTCVYQIDMPDGSMTRYETVLSGSEHAVVYRSEGAWRVCDLHRDRLGAITSAMRLQAKGHHAKVVPAVMIGQDGYAIPGAKEAALEKRADRLRRGLRGMRNRRDDEFCRLRIEAGPREHFHALTGDVLYANNRLLETVRRLGVMRQQKGIS